MHVHTGELRLSQAGASLLVVLKPDGEPPGELEVLESARGTRTPPAGPRPARAGGHLKSARGRGWGSQSLERFLSHGHFVLINQCAMHTTAVLRYNVHRQGDLG